MEKITYSTLIDYTLRVLKYAKDESKEDIGYLSLTDVIDFLNYKLPFGQIIELGKYLETRGWAKVLSLIGNVRAQLTTAGLVYLEDKNDDFYAYFNEYLNSNHKKLSLAIFKHDSDPKQKIVQRITDISEQIKKKEGRETDFNRDLEIVQLEIKKVNPDLRLIEQKLNQLSNISYIIDEIQELKDYIFTSSNYTPLGY